MGEVVRVFGIRGGGDEQKALMYFVRHVTVKIVVGRSCTDNEKNSVEDAHVGNLLGTVAPRR